MSRATIHLMPRMPRRCAGAAAAADARVQWTRRFGRRLLELQPALSARCAAHCARSMFAEAADVEPEDAALILSAEEPPGHRVAGALSLVMPAR